MKKKIVTVKTCETTRLNSKAPYKEVNLIGKANREFLFYSVLAESIVPFAVINPFVIHLPVNEANGRWTYKSSEEMLADGYSDSSEWFGEVERSFAELCKTGMSIFETLNYFGKLEIQNPNAKFWVLFCKSGKNACAAVFENSAKIWVDHTIYWHVPVAGRTEADYLAAVLNSDSLNTLIKPFQTKGLLGERDIHKKILEVGIPKFDVGNKTVMKLSQLGSKIANKVSESIGDFTAKSIGKKRGDIRKRFQKEFSEIDDLVMELFKR